MQSLFSKFQQGVSFQREKAGLSHSATSTFTRIENWIFQGKERFEKE